MKKATVLIALMFLMGCADLAERRLAERYTKIDVAYRAGKITSAERLRLKNAAYMSFAEDGN